MQYKSESLEVLKYLFGSINFAGKISREEDSRKIRAHIDDLFNEHVSFAAETKANMDESHFGFPNRDSDILAYIRESLPVSDNCQIFGFNTQIWRHN
jgi:Dynein heavy chain AAA lid domain